MRPPNASFHPINHIAVRAHFHSVSAHHAAMCFLKPLLLRFLGLPTHRQATAASDDDDGLGSILLQSMCVARNIRAQRNRLRQHRLRLQQQATAATLEKLVSGLVHASDAHSTGLETGSRYLATCLEMAARSGAPLDLALALADMPDEQLYDALLAQRLPTRPATPTEAFSRVEASFHAVKLAQEHHLPRCIDHLVKIARAAPSHGPRAAVAMAARPPLRTPPVSPGWRRRH